MDSVKISDLTSASVSELTVNDIFPIVNGGETKKTDIYDAMALASRQKRSNYGRTYNIYISGTGGNDANIGQFSGNDGGNTAETPIKTVSRLLEIMNADRNPQYNVYFMGTEIYEIPADFFVVTQATPHFYSYEGSPTIRFLKASGTTSARFYTGRVHFEGDTNSRLKIDAIFGSLYFEFCDIQAKYVDFLVPVGFYGCTCILSECSFNDNAAAAIATNPYLYQAYFNECNVRMTGAIEFKGTQGVQGCSIFNNCRLRLYSLAFTIHKQTQTSATAFSFVACVGYIEATFAYTGGGANQYTTLVSTNGCILSVSGSFFTGIKTFTNSFLNTVTYQGGMQVIPTSSITIANVIVSGFITDDSSKVHFTIDLPACVKDSAKANNGLSFSYTKCVGRGVSGYIDSTGSSGTTAYTIEHTYSGNQQNQIKCSFTLPNTKTNIVNNTPVELHFTGLEISFT